MGGGSRFHQLEQHGKGRERSEPCPRSDRKRQIRSQDDEEPVFDSRTCNNFVCLQGSSWSCVSSPPGLHKPLEGEPGEGKGCLVGALLSPCSQVSLIWEWPYCCALRPPQLSPQGLRRKRLGLKSDLPGLVWVHFASLEIRVPS